MVVLGEVVMAGPHVARGAGGNVAITGIMISFFQWVVCLLSILVKP